MSNSKLLAIVARLHPVVWEVIGPHNPALRGMHSRAEEVALNPQPIPPGEEFLAGAAMLAHEQVRAAVTLNQNPGEAVDLIQTIIADWEECGTRWPHWPLPWPGPFPGAGVDELRGPSPMPWDIATAQVIVAIIFASAAARLGAFDHRSSDDKERGALGTALAEGADRLTHAALAVGAVE